MVCDVCAEMPTLATGPGLADSLRIRSKPDTIQIIRILQNCTAISVFSSSKIQIIPVLAYFRHISRIRTRWKRFFVGTYGTRTGFGPHGLLTVIIPAWLRMVRDTWELFTSVTLI